MAMFPWYLTKQDARFCESRLLAHSCCAVHPKPLRCFKCQKFGHGQNTRRGRLICARYGQFDLDSKSCQNEMACTNCDGKQFAYSRWNMEKNTQSNN